MPKKFKPIAILGAGSWGTALALHLSKQGQKVHLWSFDSNEIIALSNDRMNKQFLPGFPFTDLIHPIAELSEALLEVEDIIMAVPSHGYRNTLKLLKPLMTPSMRITNVSKGLDAESGQLLNAIVEEVLGKDCQFAILSGPSFAREVAAGLMTSVVIASKHRKFKNDLMKRFNSENFRTYPSDDVIGVELGGVIKNILAIAIGLSDGMQLGANFRSALLTHGLAETLQLGVALGGKPKTFIGLAGLGDLILTSLDDQSRNRRLGLKLGQGINPKAAEHEIGQAVEGKRNAELIVKLAQQHNVSMPICESVHKILQGEITTKEAIEKMFSRT